jgi:inward rectifier potassium channel
LAKEKTTHSYNREKFHDLGFGTKVTDANTRLLNRNGRFNVKRTGLPFLRSLSLYHSLITMSWFKFFGIIILVFFMVNTFFAILYLLTGIEHLKGSTGETLVAQFWDAFFFSTQTFTTVGYGGITPSGFVTNIIASTETMLGWLAFALAAGLLYGRFSRPMAKILFSDRAIIAPYHNITAFEFRIANARASQLIEVETQVILSRIDKLPDGKQIRKFFELELERKKVDFLAMSWTVVHPIYESSPLFGWNKETLDQSDAEFLILIKAFDDTFSQTVHTRSSYRFNEIIWGAKFNSMYDNEEEGITTLRLNEINNVEMVDLSEYMPIPVKKTME